MLDMLVLGYGGRWRLERELFLIFVFQNMIFLAFLSFTLRVCQHFDKFIEAHVQ
jgi:hypothetical protein